MFDKKTTITKESDCQLIESKGSHSKKWNQGLNISSISLADFDVIDKFKVHDLGSGVNYEQLCTGSAHPSINSATWIESRVNYKALSDELYFLSPKEKDSVNDKHEEFQPYRPMGDITVEIQSGKLIKDNEFFKDGFYLGYCSKKQNGIYMLLTIPDSQFKEIVHLISSNPNINLEVQVGLIAYTPELDEAARDTSHPKKIIIPRNAYVAALGITVKRRPLLSTATKSSKGIDVTLEDSPYSQLRSLGNKINLLLIIFSMLALWVIYDKFFS